MGPDCSRASASRSRRDSISRRMPAPPPNVLLDDLRAAWSRAFSLIEVLIVVGIIGTIAAIVVPVYMDALDKARVAHAIGDIAVLSEEISFFWFDNSRYPDSLAEIGRGGMLDPYGEPYEYLNIADAGPGGGGGGGGRGGRGGGGGGGGSQASGARKDRFLVPVNSDFDLYSTGKDKESAPPFSAPMSHDDIVRANNGMFVGLAEEF